VTGTMAITSGCYFVVLREDWKWPLWKALPLLLLFLLFDLPFFASNLLKFVDGGYVPILVATALFALMLIWRRGRSVLIRRLSDQTPPFAEFVERNGRACAIRVPGTGIFLTGQTHGTPAVLLHYLRHAQALHERLLVLTIITDRVPRVPLGSGASVEDLGHGFLRVTLHTGFMEKPMVPERLADAMAQAGLELNLKKTTFFVGHETFLATAKGEMGSTAETIFSLLYRNAASATSWFGLPPEGVMELGMQLDL